MTCCFLVPGSGWYNSGDQALAKLSVDNSVIANHDGHRTDRVGQRHRHELTTAVTASSFNVLKSGEQLDDLEVDRGNTQAFKHKDDPTLQ